MQKLREAFVQDPVQYLLGAMVHVVHANAHNLVRIMDRRFQRNIGLAQNMLPLSHSPENQRCNASQTLESLRELRHPLPAPPASSWESTHPCE